MKTHRTRFSVVKKYLSINTLPSKTKKEFKKSCDINHILKKYCKTGFAPVMRQKAIYGDFSNPVDFQEAQNICINAEMEFMKLPAAMRKRFNNDPATYLDFVSDEKNVDEMIKMGILEAPKPEAGQPIAPSPGGVENKPESSKE